jgi:hypothetical protein
VTDHCNNLTLHKLMQFSRAGPRELVNALVAEEAERLSSSKKRDGHARALSQPPSNCPRPAIRRASTPSC